MKIRYQFVNGDVSEIEVDDALGEVLLDLDRQEYNNNRKETRRHYSLESRIYEGEDYGAEDENLSRFADLESIRSAMLELTSRQRICVYAYFFDGKKYTEIARELGIHESTVRESVRSALKKLEKYLR